MKRTMIIKLLILITLFTTTVFSQENKRLRSSLDNDASVDKMRSAIVRQLAMSPPDDINGNQVPQEVSIALPIQFEFGSSVLTNEGKETLNKAAAAMNSSDLKDLNFVVEGHTDSVGSNAYNLSLSQKRAYAAKNQLIAAGVSAQRLNAIGFGESKPIENLSTLDAAQRRVELVTKR